MNVVVCISVSVAPSLASQTLMGNFEVGFPPGDHECSLKELLMDFLRPWDHSVQFVDRNSQGVS